MTFTVVINLLISFHKKNHQFVYLCPSILRWNIKILLKSLWFILFSIWNIYDNYSLQFPGKMSACISGGMNCQTVRFHILSKDMSFKKYAIFRMFSLNKKNHSIWCLFFPYERAYNTCTRNSIWHIMDVF